MHVVVTGGSSGIGLEVAKCYARQGASVSIIARNRERLDTACQDIKRHVPQARLFIGVADVSVSSDLERVLQASESELGQCDILIVSAGIVDPAHFHEQPAGEFAAQWEVNFVGAVNAVRNIYSEMRRRGSGRIMIVSSATAFIGIPGYASYCASKSALVGFVDSLRLEAMAAGVYVGICFPPDTDTPQLAYELRKRPHEAEMLMGRIRARPAEEIAEKIVASVDRKVARVYFTASVACLAMFGPAIKPWIGLWFRFFARRVSPDR